MIGRQGWRVNRTRAALRLNREFDQARNVLDRASRRLSRSRSRQQAGHALGRGPFAMSRQLGPVGKIGWYIPSYMLDDHPELATWEGFLDDDNAALFATAETGKKGQFLAGAPGWTQYDEQIIHNLGLNLEVVYAGSEEAILAAVESAYRRQAPVLFYFWTPHSIHAEYDLTEVALPEYTDECYAGVAEGNTDNIACDYPADKLFKIFWAGLEDAYPEVFTFLSKMNYTTEDQIAMVAAVDFDVLTIEEAAEAWIEENEDVWRVWLPDPK